MVSESPSVTSARGKLRGASGFAFGIRAVRAGHVGRPMIRARAVVMAGRTHHRRPSSAAGIEPRSAATTHMSMIATSYVVSMAMSDERAGGGTRWYEDGSRRRRGGRSAAPPA